MRRNKNTDHGKTLRYFTNKWKTRLDNRKPLIIFKNKNKNDNNNKFVYEIKCKKNNLLFEEINKNFIKSS